VNPRRPGRRSSACGRRPRPRASRSRRGSHLPGVRRRPRALGRPRVAQEIRKHADATASPRGPLGGRSRSGRRALRDRQAHGLGEASWTRTRSRRSSRPRARARRGARGCRRAAPRANGDEVTYVVTRNINYTTSATSAAASAPSRRGKLAENLRGAPYLVPLDEVVRRCREAWERGAVEVCLQGGIHPAFTGDYYVELVEAIKRELPGPARARVLGARGLAGRCDARPVRSPTTSRVCATRARLPSRARPRRSSTTRCAGFLCPDKVTTGAVARGARDGPRGGLPLDGDDHVRGRGGARASWARHSIACASCRSGPGGFTGASCPLPLRAHGGADLPQGERPARPHVREAVLMHAGRAASRSIRTSRTSRPQWVKMGVAERRRASEGRRNDLGGTLMNEVRSRARPARARAGDAARRDGGGDPRARAHAAASDDASTGSPAAERSRALVRAPPPLPSRSTRT
jgi:hypothetical protein